MSPFNPGVAPFIPVILPYQLQSPTDLQKSTPYGNPATLATGQLGIPVISWIDFFDASGNKILTICECLISVKQNPKIVKTYSAGKDGSVKTWVGKDDYEITIEGYIFNVNKDGTSSGNSEGTYPVNRMNTLQTILSNQGNNLGIKVFSPFLELFGNTVGNYSTGIDFIVITNIDTPQEEGQYSQQKFTITAISDSAGDSTVVFSPYYI